MTAAVFARHHVLWAELDEMAFLLDDRAAPAINVASVNKQGVAGYGGAESCGVDVLVTHVGNLFPRKRGRWNVVETKSEACEEIRLS